jgi:hypothetical protein
MHKRGDRWTCPRCGTRYRLSRPIRRRWWRNWAAPTGEWRRRFGARGLDRALSGQGSRWPPSPLKVVPGAAQGVPVGVASSPVESAGAFDRWALEEGILSQAGEEQAAVLMRAFTAGYRHAMAICDAELEAVKRAGYDVFREGRAGIRGSRRRHGPGGTAEELAHGRLNADSYKAN